MRVAPPTHDNFLFTRHGCHSAYSVVAVYKRVEQPDDEQEACDAAEHDADDGARLRPRGVVVGGYDARLDEYLLALCNWQSLRLRIRSRRG